MIWVAVGVLREVRPVWLYIIAATLFVLSQLDYFLLNKVRSIRVDASKCDDLFDVPPGDLQWHARQGRWKLRCHYSGNGHCHGLILCLVQHHRR